MSEAESNSRPDRFDLVGQVLQGQFEIVRCVAEGGFGVVYYGIQKPFGRPVALKVLKLPEDMGPKTRRKVEASFLTEGTITANLNIPGIVQVLSAGVLERGDGERNPWLALQWIAGPTLKTWLSQRRESTPGPMEPREALALMRPVFVALGRAHREHRIAHRDVKPGNIMVVEKDGHRDLYVVDFGIAKSMETDEVADTAMTQLGGIGFSPQYAAREQLAKHRSGPWTDVHALGLIMTELLTDAPAYRGRNPADLVTEIVSPERPTPGRAGVDVGAWEPILERALAIESRKRYPDALEFLAALENARTDVAKSPVEIFSTARTPDHPVEMNPPATAYVAAPTSTAPVASTPDPVATPQGSNPIGRLTLIGIGTVLVAGLGLAIAFRPHAPAAPESVPSTSGQPTVAPQRGTAEGTPPPAVPAPTPRDPGVAPRSAALAAPPVERPTLADASTPSHAGPAREPSHHNARPQRPATQHELEIR